MDQRTILTLLASAALAVACSNSADDGTGGGSQGGGGAGGEVGCPEGSHDVEDGCESTLKGWQESGALSEPRDHHISFIATTKDDKPYYFVVGGMVDQQTLLDKAERAPVLDDGTLGPWETLTRMPRTMAGHGFTRIGDTLILAGGFGGPGRGSNKVDLVTLGDDGSLQEYRTAPAFKEKRLHVSLESNGNRVYAIGGFGDTDNTPTIETAELEDGELSAWSSARSMPEKRSHHASAATSKGIYVLGGLQGDPSDSLTIDSVLYAPFEKDGALGEWQTLTALPNPTSVMSAVAFADHLWVFGGLNSTSFLKSVWRAKIEEDGTIGPWVEQPKLPKVRGHVHQVPIFRGKVYNGGGFSASGSQDQIYIGELE